MTMQTHEGPPAGVIARPTGQGKFETALSVRDVTIVADEPERRRRRRGRPDAL